MVAILDKLQELVGIKKDEANADVPVADTPIADATANVATEQQDAPVSLTAEEAALAESFMAPANDHTPATPAEAAANDFSLSRAASDVLVGKLKAHTVMKYGHEAKVGFPVEKVEFKPHDQQYEIQLAGEASNIPRGQRVTLAVTLDEPAVDHDTSDMKDALPALLNEAIPQLQGKFIAKPANDTTHIYQDVMKELIADVLKDHTGAFTPAELNVLEQHAQAHVADKDEASIWRRGAIEVMHRDGKIAVRIDAQELPSDKDATVSSDHEVMTFFNANREAILAHVKEKVLALNIEGVTAESLANLDMNVEVRGWSIEAKLGAKPTKDTDAEGKKLTGEAYSKQMGETALAKVDTKLLDKIFTDALIESNKELQPIMARIIDAQMLADILRKRLPNDPKLAEFLAKHDVFKTQEEVHAEAEKAAQEHSIILSEARICKAYSSDKDQITVDFDLPHGMTIQQLLANILTAKSTPDTTVSAPEKIGMLEAANVKQEVTAAGRAA